MVKKKSGVVLTTPPETTSQSPANGTCEVDLSLIYPNPDQPRKFFPKEALEELVLSIQEQGLIEPLIVVQRGGKFMLVAGERRWRACQMLGLEKVPVRVIEADDRQVAELALVENLQRQDLNPLEEARAFQNMLEQGYSKDKLAQKLGFKRTNRIDERLNLLNLAPKFQEALLQGVITPLQASWLGYLTDYGDQELVFKKLKEGKLPTIKELRAFVLAVAKAKKQLAMFNVPKPNKEESEVMSRWEKILGTVYRLITQSFSKEDCRVLAKVCHGNMAANLERLELIIKHLKLIRKAMLNNIFQQEAARLTAKPGKSG